MITTVPFGELFSLIRNGLSVKQDKSGDGLPITRIETISAGVVDAERVGFAGLSLEEGADWLLQDGDILFSHINSVDHIGKCAVYRREPELLVHGMNLLCLRADVRHLQPEYAKWLIRSSGFRSRLSNFVNKAVNQASVSIGNLRTIPVVVPSVQEQRRIAAILDQAEELRARRRQALAKLDTLTQSLFLEMFGDPTTNPKGWSKGRIGDLLDSANYGSSLKASTKGAYPMLRMNNLTSDGRFNLSDLKYIDIPKSQESRWLVCEGDILFNRTNSVELVGKTAVFRQGRCMAYAGYLIRLRVNARSIPEYISAVLNSTYGKATLKGMCKSIIGMANINAKEVQLIPIAMPPIDLQRRFGESVLGLEPRRTEIIKSVGKFDSLFASLQHRAFRGKL